MGDVRQHQGVEAGRPFEQLQEAGMLTAELNRIIRQRDPGLKQAVERLLPKAGCERRSKASQNQAAFMRSRMQKQGCKPLRGSMLCNRKR